MPSRRLKRRNSEDFFCTKERLHNMLSNYSWPRKGRNKSASSIWRAFWPHIGHERVRNQPHNELEKVFIFKNALRWLGHPKYLLIFNYGIGIKTGIHFQLRNWLRNWEFEPKVANIAKFLQNSWQAWICEMLWWHFFSFQCQI